MSSLKTRILERLQGRMENAIRNRLNHPDLEVRHDAKVREDAYACALADVETLFYEDEVKWAALIARDLFPTEEERVRVAAALKIPSSSSSLSLRREVGLHPWLLAV